MATKYATGSDQIAEAFARIEDELLESMFRNLERHEVEEVLSGRQWVQWQTAQIAELERYARGNGLRYGPAFDRLNGRIEDMVRYAYDTGRHAEEGRILDAVSKGAEIERQEGFLRLPEERMDALVKATHDDLVRAEHATLRKAVDVYRQTIFDAEVYAVSGAGTYAKAIDMATHDFVAKGINGIQYRNGSWHGIEEYSRMVVRTATKRAALVAEGDARREWGVHTVFVNYRTDACPECMEWVGRVLVDDVYSGGTPYESYKSGYPLLSDAMARGLFHPNCKDTCSTYFEGVSELPDRPTAAEKRNAEDREASEQMQDRMEDNAERYRRLERFSLDMGDSRAAGIKAEEWEGRLEDAASGALAAEEMPAVSKEEAEAAFRRNLKGSRASHAEGMADIVAGMEDQTAARVAVDNAADIRFTARYNRRGEYYDPRGRAMNVNLDLSSMGTSYRSDMMPYETFFHEYGHLIDYKFSGTMYHGISYERRLGHMVMEEFKAMENALKKEMGFKSVNDARKVLADRIMELYSQDYTVLGGLGDMYFGATRGRAPLWGVPKHTASYFEGEEGIRTLATEAFAEFFECATANPRALETLKEWLPQSYDLWCEIMRDIAGGAL